MEPTSPGTRELGDQPNNELIYVIKFVYIGLLQEIDIGGHRFPLKVDFEFTMAVGKYRIKFSIHCKGVIVSESLTATVSGKKIGVFVVPLLKNVKPRQLDTFL